MNMIRRGQDDGLDQNALLKYNFIDELVAIID